MTDRPDDHDVPHAPDAAEPWQDPAPIDGPTAHGAGDPASGKLWPVVVQALAEREWTYDPMGEHGALVRVRGSATNYDVAISTFEDLAVVRCVFAMHLYVAEPWRPAACDLINRINHDELLLGGFEIDVESGRVRWRQACDVEGGALTVGMVQNLVSAGFWACDRFWPALLATGVLGMTPEAALEIAREG